MKRLVFTVIAVLFAAVFVNAQNSVPVVTTTGADIVSSGTVTFKATVDPKGSPTTVYFEYRYKGASNFTQTGYAVSQTLTVGEVSKTVSGLLADTIVEFRVKAINDIGSTSGNILETPTSIAGSNGGGSGITAGGFTLVAENVAGDYATLVLGYVSNVPVRVYCEYDISGGFFDETTDIKQRSAGSGIVEFNIIGLTPKTSYDYRAVILPDGGGVIYANVVSFTTDAATGIEDLEAEVEIGIFPNPVMGNLIDQVEIRYGNKDGWFKLFDISGRKVQAHPIIEGRGKLFDTVLKPGVYFYQIYDKSWQKVEAVGKLVVIK